VSQVQAEIGDKAPAFVGATASGRFWSLDAQAGRPALIVALGSLGAEAARQMLEALASARPALEAAGVDLVPIAPLSPAFSACEAAREQLVHVAGAGGLESWQVDGRPGVMGIDRSGRIVALASLGGPCDATKIAAEVASGIAPLVGSEPARTAAFAAPVLIVPNVMSRPRCQAFIEHFEASPHEAGRMAGLDDAGAVHKLDESLKLRRDIELAAGAPLHGEVMDVMARRCVPEIKRAFQKDVSFADRILVARYDDTGGYFKRHRDNALPHTAFREFAVSINLNTHDYEGGALRFPEYDDTGYSAPAGGAMIFSASLLHEAAPVTKGRRYVILSFLSSTPA
jgi:predicted 2-oxoglutarate/Fe(II)-dependent dioxygenase YbiX/stage V sporulation protein SpoVS